MRLTVFSLDLDTGRGREESVPVLPACVAVFVVVVPGAVDVGCVEGILAVRVAAVHRLAHVAAEARGMGGVLRGKHGTNLKASDEGK